MGRDARGNLRGLPGGPALVGPGGGRISTQPAEVWDAFNRPLEVGDMVQLHTEVPPIFRVQQIARVVETGLPDGLMEIEVFARLKFRTPRAQPNLEFVRILQKAETEQQQGQQGQQEQVPEPPARVEDPDSIRGELHADGFSQLDPATEDLQ